DGIRDKLVTGVQTCALPIFPTPNAKTLLLEQGDRVRVTLKDTPVGLLSVVEDLTTGASGFMLASAANGFEAINSSDQAVPFDFRSEERRVGKECRSGRLAVP